MEPDLHSDLKGIMDEMTKKVHDEYPDGFFGTINLQLWKPII